MSIKRILAILLQEYYITIRSMEVIADIFFFPLVNVVVFGFISIYLTGSNALAGKYVLLGMLLWQIIWIIEYSITLGSLWNIWSRNLSNLFVAPLQAKEHIAADLISGMVKTGFILFISSILSVYVFHFNLFSIGIVSLICVFINFALFAFAFGIMILGFIFRYGTRLSALSWGVIPVFQPLCAAFFAAVAISCLSFPADIYF
jgi:ABC-2 type transport system permease protein